MVPPCAWFSQSSESRSEVLVGRNQASFSSLFVSIDSQHSRAALELRQAAAAQALRLAEYSANEYIVGRFFPQSVPFSESVKDSRFVDQWSKLNSDGVPQTDGSVSAVVRD